MKTLIILTLLFCFVEVKSQIDSPIKIGYYPVYENTLIVENNQKFKSDSIVSKIIIDTTFLYNTELNPTYKDLITYNNNLFEQNIKLNSELEKTKKDRNFWRCAFEMVVLVVGVGLVVKR